MPRLTLCTIEPKITATGFNPFSQGIRQLRAAVEADRALQAWDVRFVETESKDVDLWVETLRTEAPDVIGFSCFVWSFPTFLRVAERLRAILPSVRIVFGGPSARVVMFQQPGMAGRERVLDALIAGEGEWSLVALLKLPSWDLQAVTSIPGVWVPTQTGWRGGRPQLDDCPLDDLPSAILAGLCDSRRTATLERFRGCPMSCSFCQWGDLTTPHRVFSEGRIRAELQYLKDHGATSLALIDAGLNLNTRAFRNLAAAEADVGFLRDARLYTCIYPSIVTDEHLAFLARCNAPTIDMGVQSFNPVALKAIDRPFREDRFESVFAALKQVCVPEPEMIFGLPGDNPKSFKDGILRLLNLGCRVRAFHCLVLPDALMSRAKPEYALQWDPETLLVTSCLGWSARDLAETREWLDRLTDSLDGDTCDNTWNFGHMAPGERKASQQLRPIRTPHEALTLALQPEVARWTSGAWSVRETGVTDQGLRVALQGADLDFHVDLVEAGRVKQSYRVLDGVAISYRTREGNAMTPAAMKLLDQLLPDLVATIAPTLRTLPTRAPTTPDVPKPRKMAQILGTPTRESVAALWQQQGVVVLEKVVPVEECERIVDVLNRHVTQAAEAERAQPWPEALGARLKASAHTVVPFWDPDVPADRPPVDRLMRLGHQLHRIPEVRALLRRPEIVGMLGVTLPSPRLVNAVLIDKVPGGTVQFGMHQDAWFLLSEPDTLVSLQIALDDTDEENGCLHLMPTDPNEVLTVRARLTADGWERGEELHPPPADADAPAMPMSRGSVLLYTGRTWHASYPNRSQRHRRVLVAQFIDASSRWLAENWLTEPPGGFPDWR